jgi:amino acid transporter
VPLTPLTTKLVSIVAIVVMTWINIIGVKNGARLGNVLTILKVGGLIVMVLCVFLLPPQTAPAPRPRLPLPAGPVPVGAIGIALVAVLWRTRVGTTSPSRRPR